MPPSIVMDSTPYKKYNTIEKVMLNIDEALLNLKENYPGRDLANCSFGALGNYLGHSYKPTRMVIVFDEETGICRLRRQ